MEAPLVVMDDEFLANFSKVYAEKITPAMNELLNEQIRKGMKYSYYAFLAS